MLTEGDAEDFRTNLFMKFNKYKAGENRGRNQTGIAKGILSLLHHCFNPKLPAHLYFAG